MVRTPVVLYHVCLPREQQTDVRIKRICLKVFRKERSENYTIKLLKLLFTILINSFVIFSLSTDWSPYARVQTMYSIFRENWSGSGREDHTALSRTRGRWRWTCVRQVGFYNTQDLNYKPTEQQWRITSTVDYCRFLSNGSVCPSFLQRSSWFCGLQRHDINH